MGWFRSEESPDRVDASTVDERMAAIGPGVPGRCPRCDGLGYIDRLDIGHRYQIQHCKECAHRWEYLFDRDGHVVGLTELDDAGQPVSRTRVRHPNRPLVAEHAPAPAPEPAPERVVDLREPAGDDEVLDLREPAPAPSDGDDDVDPSRLSPAAWLRHALRR
jgi:hypothetical protein